MDIHSILKSLSKKRTIFHAEVDFQFALAREIRLANSNAEVWTEFPLYMAGADSGNSKTWKKRLDIWVDDGSTQTSIELKYKVRDFEGEDEKGEGFSLSADGADTDNLRRYMEDIDRLESVVGNSFNKLAYAIMLSDDPAYSKLGRTNEITAFLAAGFLDGAPNRKKPIPAIRLNHSYYPHWKEYSQLQDSGSKSHNFEYLLTEIRPQNKLTTDT